MKRDPKQAEMRARADAFAQTAQNAERCPTCETVLIHGAECQHCAAQEQAPQQKRRIPLTVDQRRKLFAGETPKIIFPGPKPPCPVPVGHIEVLSNRVSIEVTEIRRTKEGEHALGYTLHNENLGARFLAKQHGQSAPEQYVTSPAGSIDDEGGQAVDSFTQSRISNEARAKAQKDVTEHLRALERLEDTLTAEMETRNLATRGEMQQARARIRRAKRKILGQSAGLEAADDQAA